MQMVRKLPHNMLLERKLLHNMPQERKPPRNMLLERKPLHNTPLEHKLPKRTTPYTHRMMQHSPIQHRRRRMPHKLHQRMHRKRRIF